MTRLRGQPPARDHGGADGPEAGDLSALPPRVAAYLAELAAHVERLAGPALRGVYVLGSTAVGDHRPGRSDLDVAAITTAVPPRPLRQELAAALDHASLPVPARKLEFVLYAEADLAVPEGPRYALNLNTGPGEHHASYDHEEDPWYWFAVDVAIAREHAVALCGPPASRVFPALPRPLVLRALADALGWYRDEDVSGPRVLAACRARRWARDGIWSSKGDAARHVPSADRHAAVVAAALAERETGDPPPDERAATELVEEVLAELRAQLAA